MDIKHAISVDVEDWYQSTIDVDADLSDRFRDSTDSSLKVLEAMGVRGTFFVLGLVAKKAPDVVRRIAAAGHNVQSHGYSHRDNRELTRDELRSDLLRAKKLIEDITGREIFGYRAPCFSIEEQNMWALDILVETGHRYDSSIFPVKTDRYGINDYPPEPRIVATPSGGRIVEAPVATFNWLGKRRPVGGGGYFRLWPYWVIRKAWRQMERTSRPGIVYMHPYEYDLREMNAYRHSVPFAKRLHQGVGRRGFPRKIDRLLKDFRFASMEDVLEPLLKDLRNENSDTYSRGTYIPAGILRQVPQRAET